jgi:outer membrane protein assembly factor BamB
MFTVLAAVGLAGCSETPKPPLPGERVAVLTGAGQLRPDPAVAAIAPEIPAPAGFAEWPQAGGNVDHEGGHAPLSATPQIAWRADAGSGSSGARLLLAQPVVAAGRVFVVDADYDVTAFDAQTGRRAWSVSARSRTESDDVRGGGIAFAEGRVFVSTGYGELIALDAADGREVWRSRIRSPARSAPTVVGGRVMVVTLDNLLVAVAASNGEPRWDVAGIRETAGLVGGAAPASDGSVVVAPFSSGDVIAIRLESGRQVWNDSLASVRRGTAVSALADIIGHPVISRGLVIAISHGGRMVAIDARTGNRAWEQDFGGVDTPWVVGGEVFVLTTASEVVALTRRQGQVRWISQMPRFERPDRRDTAIGWTGPVLAGGRLWLASSRSELVGLDPTNGSVGTRIPLPGPVRISPVVAGGTMYVLTDGGELVALR